MDYERPLIIIDFGRDGIHTIKQISKLLGSTVDYAVINLGFDLFARGQAYVALSRIRSLDGVLIEDLNCEKLTGKKPCHEKSKDSDP